MPALYNRIANALIARNNCVKSGNEEWMDIWSDRLADMIKEHMPSGSGFDNGTAIDEEQSNDTKLVFRTAFHHMNDAGFYDGWTDHNVVVRPNLLHGITVYVSGRNKRDIKDYIGEVFHEALTKEVPN